MERALSEPTASPMMIRLANVIYWGCTAIAVLLLSLCAYLVLLSNVLYASDDPVKVIILAAVFYGVGRGVLYVIAAR